MREYPIFVTHAGERLAAVVTLPDSQVPRGMVLQLPGTGLYDVIGSRLCLRASRRLATQGFASVRLDYAGIGDSTGAVPTWSLNDTGHAAGAVREILRVAMQATGTAEFALVATCYGTRLAFELAEERNCSGAVCLAAPIIDWGTWTRMRRTARTWRLVGLIKSQRLFRRLLLVPLRALLGERQPTPRVVETLLRLDGPRVLFLYTDGTRDYFNERVRGALETMIAATPKERPASLEYRVIEHGPLTAFDVLSKNEQDKVLDMVVEWISGCFDDALEPARGEREARPVLAT
jgi:pimeloyl-ACP methyl ester carboxylesterase